MAAAIITISALAALGLLGYLSVHLMPRAFGAYPGPVPELQTVPLPGDLPGPVCRFFAAITDGRIPLIHSAVISARGYLRLGGLRFPMRMRMIHQVGKGYRRYIEITLLGFPVMKVNEWYLDGRGRSVTPGGVIENDPKWNAAANIALWAEAIYFPSIFLTDPRVRWEPVDETHARLEVPSPEGTDALTVTFDPVTGLLQEMSAMRWQNPTDAGKKLWRVSSSRWRRFHGILLPAGGSAAWEDDKPWLDFTAEEVRYNVDVAEAIGGTGP